MTVQRRDIMSVAGLVMLAVTMLGIGILTSKTVKEMQLLRDAETTALRWAKFFEDRREDTWTVFRNRRSPVAANAIGWKTQDVGRIIAYELYDRNGNLFYTTGAANWLPSTMAGTLLRSPITRKHNEAGLPTTRLYKPKTNSATSHYASVAIPFHLANEYLGSVVAFVDQSEQADSLTYSFGVIATTTILLLLISIGAAGYVVMSKSRERTTAIARARYLTDHDELTGLPNRQSFTAKLEELLATTSPNESGKPKVTVLFLDINRFKEINGAHGHRAGDGVLSCAAKRIQEEIGEGDFAARLGSNEFAIILASAKTAREVNAFVRRLRISLDKPYVVGGDSISCSYSIGAALAPSDGEDAASLAHHANLALNRAKAEGTGTLTFFEHSMNIAFQRRREREKDMKNAIKRGEFEVHFQQQVCLDTNQVCGHEALLRWQHPVHGKISPAYFIPLAEETELIVPIGEWVLRKACAEAVGWSAPLKVAVNLSPVQFKHGGVADVVDKVLKETGLEPGRLELEITESVLIGDTETVVTELDKLRELGVAIAMDDFGTGYSSLSYISRFPFNKIKIDRSFIHAMAQSDALNAIVKCIIAMGHSLGVTVTAEGVESEEQAELLRSYGCHEIQGFLYGYPMSAEECAKKIAASTTAEPVSTSRAKSTKAA